MIEIEDKFNETHGLGMQCPEVRARMALLNADLRFIFMIIFLLKSFKRIYIIKGSRKNLPRTR